MRTNILRIAALLAAIALLAAAGSCSLITASDGDLFALPETAAQYRRLYGEVEALLDGGTEYSAPTSGYNRQSVQLEDLNGDGVQEAVVFLRTTDELPLRMCVFEQHGDEGERAFALAAAVSLEGGSFDSVTYSDVDADGARELIVGRSIGSGVPKALSVLSLEAGEFSTLLSVSYTAQTLFDLDSDGIQEIIVARHDQTELTGTLEAYVYSPGEREMTLRAEVALSTGMESFTQLSAGSMLYGVPAVFVVGTCNGKADVLTDVCAYRLGRLTNVTLSEETGRSVDIAPASSISLSDIGDDGVLDIPRTVSLKPYDARRATEVFKKVVWRSYRLDGGVEETWQSYHASAGDWYLILPEEWRDGITVDRRDTVTGERTVVFSYIYQDADGAAQLADLLVIYVLTGDNREDRSTLAGRFVIDTAQTRAARGVIYAARIIDPPAGMEHLAVTQETVRSLFRLVSSEWLDS